MSSPKRAIIGNGNENKWPSSQSIWINILMTEICVPWNSQSNTWWNEICANIVDHFGLPGDKYTTEVSADEMKFFFKDEREALLCKILISDQI